MYIFRLQNCIANTILLPHLSHSKIPALVWLNLYFFVSNRVKIRISTKISFHMNMNVTRARCTIDVLSLLNRRLDLTLEMSYKIYDYTIDKY